MAYYGSRASDTGNLNEVIFILSEEKVSSVLHIFVWYKQNRRIKYTKIWKLNDIFISYYIAYTA